MQILTLVRLRQDLPTGTVIEELDDQTVLVEFVDELGKTVVLSPVPKVLLTHTTCSFTRHLLDVVAVEALPGFVLRLTFENGDIRRFPMSKLLARDATVFASLRRKKLFRKVFIANGSVCWPGGADIDPELLYEQSVPEGQFESIYEQPASSYPVDAAWENMPEVGLEKWSDGGSEKDG